MKNRILFLSFIAVFAAVNLFDCYSDAGNDFISILDYKAEKLLGLYNVPGLAVAVAGEGEVILARGYGWADKKNRRPVREDTLFQAASNSKCVAAWGIMKLVSGNKIGLDVPVQGYLTRWHFPPSPYELDQVTVRRLLSHTAGLSTRAYPGYNPRSRLPSLEESLTGIQTGQPGVRVITEPGRKYLYSGGGYTILQLVIEEVTGRPFVDFMDKEVLEPLDMTGSSYKWDTSFPGKAATAYDLSGNPLPNYVFTEKAAAGLMTTATDYARFIGAVMKSYNGSEQGTELPDRETVTLMFTPVKEYHGLGFKIRTLKDSTRYVYHGGTNRGWRSQFAFLPERKTGIVILTNSDNGEDVYSDILRLWTQSVLGYVPGFLNRFIIFRVIIWGSILGAGIFLIIFLINLAGGIISRKYTMFTNLPHGQGSTIFFRTGKIILIVIFPITWYLVFYTSIFFNGWIIAGKMPFGFFYLTILLFAWCCVLSVRFLFTKDKNRIFQAEDKA